MKKFLLSLLLLLASFAQADVNTVSQSPVGAGSDAFGRSRVSEPFTIFDSHQFYQQETMYWTTSTFGTGAAVTFDSAFSSNTLTSGTTATSLAGIQTKTYFPYFPGKSQLIYMTGNFMGTQANVIKRIGSFDDRNGLFFQISGTAFSVVTRTYTSGAAVNSTTSQANFNMDPLDGTGPSGYNIDFTKAQIFIIDFEWLGVGRVRYGVWANDRPVYCHTSYGTNVNTGVYMQRPNLPVRYEVRNNGSVSGGSMSLICASIQSEGGIGKYQQGGVATAPAGLAGSTGVWKPLVALRVKSTFSYGAAIRPLNYFAGGLGNSNNGNIYLAYNAQVSGGTWVSVTNSAVEYNVTATDMTITNTACVIIQPDASLAGNRTTGKADVDPFLWGGFDWNQTTADTWVLGVNQSGGAANWVGGIGWEESR